MDESPFYIRPAKEEDPYSKAGCYFPHCGRHDDLWIIHMMVELRVAEREQGPYRVRLCKTHIQQLAREIQSAIKPD